MAINFPNSPVNGQVYNVSPGISFVYRGTKWVPAPMKTALPKNYIVNPSAQVSQELGLGVYSAASPTGNVYPADQWCAGWNLTSGTWKVGATTAGSTTPNGSPYSLEYNLTAPDPSSPGATTYQQMYQPIEGQRIADLQWGTAAAIPVVIRFWIRCPQGIPARMSFVIRNGATDYSYIGQYIVQGVNTWYKVEAAVPTPPVASVWPTTTAVGMYFGFSGMIGSNYTGVLGWQTGNKLGYQNSNWGQTSGPTNMYLADIGLYADPYMTGVAPTFATPFVADEIRRSQRYWYKAFGWNGGATAATTSGRMAMRHPVPMRITPVGSIKGAPKVFDGAVTPLITSLVTVCNPYAAEHDVTCSAGGFTGGRATTMYWQSVNDYIAMNARM